MSGAGARRHRAAGVQLQGSSLRVNVETGTAMPDEIEGSELKQALDAGADLVLVDVREPWERALASLPNVVHMPLHELPRRLGELDPERAYVFYCHLGVRSLHAVLELRRRGFRHVRSLRGGIDRWSVEIDPSVPRY